MTWWLSPDVDQNREDRWRLLPMPAITQLYGPDRYLADNSLIDAINTALFLGQPLLLTGDPGCGKTEVGNYVAWKLGLKEAIRFDIKSTTTARDLFYSFDTIGRFHAAQTSGPSIDPARFIVFQGLGRAILYANEPHAVADLLSPSAHPGKRRSVVLIDEIDKASRDVPNDLLMEIENMQFYISELTRSVTADRTMRPVVIITSNAERGLPEPFLRRCIYHNIEYPEPNRLMEIAAARIADLPRDATLLGDAVTVFEFLRHQGLRKRPGTAELLGFILAMRGRGCRTDESLRVREDWLEIAKHSLLKDKDDQEVAFKSFKWPPQC